MTDTLETLVAKQAITEVLHRYCYAMDRIDPEFGAQIRHADGMAHYGPSIFEGSAEDYLKQVFEQHAKTDATSHQPTNVVIHLDGDRATSESYVTVCVCAAGQDVLVRGRYLDTWSCCAGVWRIDDRHYENYVTQVMPTNDTIGL